MWLLEPRSPWIATRPADVAATAEVVWSRCVVWLLRKWFLNCRYIYPLGQPQHNPPQLTLANAAETAPSKWPSPDHYITRSRTMLWTITIILVILWIVGLVSSYTLGGWIHLLLVLAIIILIFNLLSGRRGI